MPREFSRRLEIISQRFRRLQEAVPRITSDRQLRAAKRELRRIERLRWRLRLARWFWGF
jgi:hypothetical protein